ncbi:SMAD/FHA domain-containing protein [Chloropicon primus]|uniref:SMAD/FHA domain-containing protein n=2 Tax=Eukaryota TaxID=2759 RepID=A0A5B8MMZ4_9CHLO|nr:SMAD/FHA domain-containing protein [Chloropicon primus]UPR01248.1 SMAD/FHA domain-containing protein [Chloropicon primus]|eukprot:QDZ22028.1 SMAD/FHA domain-containing protein [Chloropicon primus]
MNQALVKRSALSRGLGRRATRRVTSAKVVLKPIGDNDPDYVIRSGLKAPPQAVAIELSTGSSVVGRDEDCDLIIPIPTVSGSHAKVELEGETLFVTDLESTNGTFVNNERIEPGSKTQLSPGSNVIFGDSNLAAYVVQQDSAASAE